MRLKGFLPAVSPHCPRKQLARRAKSCLWPRAVSIVVNAEIISGAAGISIAQNNAVDQARSMGNEYDYNISNCTANLVIEIRAHMFYNGIAS